MKFEEITKRYVKKFGNKPLEKARTDLKENEVECPECLKTFIIKADRHGVTGKCKCGYFVRA